MGGKRERMDCSHPHSHLLEEGNPLRTLSRIRTSELCLDSVAWGMSVCGGGGGVLELLLGLGCCKEENRRELSLKLRLWGALGELAPERLVGGRRALLVCHVLGSVFWE